MNLIPRLKALSGVVRERSLIEWVKTDAEHNDSRSAYLNETLRATAGEHEQWPLFLEILSCWLDNRTTWTASALFGFNPLWKSKEPIVISKVEERFQFYRYSFTLRCKGEPICKIAGELAVIGPHYRELVAKKRNPREPLAKAVKLRATPRGVDPAGRTRFACEARRAETLRGSAGCLPFVCAIR